MSRSCMHTMQCVGELMDIHNLDREAGKIFLTGGSGPIGHRIATKLIDTGYAQVRLGTSIPSSLNHLSERNAEVVDFSWNREETYATALRGVKTVIITILYERHWYKHFAAFLKACKKANVKHYVKLSFYLSHIRGTRQIPFVKNHLHCDEMLMSLIIPDEEYLSQMSYTIISASHFMSNPTTCSNTQLNSSDTSTKMYGASNNHAANYISPNDVAEATVRVALSPRYHYNRIYTLLGPDLITSQYVSVLMSIFFGKQMQDVDVSPSELRKILLEANTPKWLINDQIAMQQIMASGLEEKITISLRNDFESICGHTPESFTEYLTDTDTMVPLEMGLSVKDDDMFV